MNQKTGDFVFINKGSKGPFSIYKGFCFMYNSYIGYTNLKGWLKDMSQLSTKMIQELCQLLKIQAFKDVKIFVEGEISLLFLLYQSPEKMLSPKEITYQLGITKGRVTALINGLSEKEMIDISISSEDRRSFNISLTEQGERFLLPKIMRAEKYIETMIERIGDEKSNLLVNIIQEIRKEMGDEA